MVKGLSISDMVGKLVKGPVQKSDEEMQRLEPPILDGIRTADWALGVNVKAAATQALHNLQAQKQQAALQTARALGQGAGGGGGNAIGGNGGNLTGGSGGAGFQTITFGNARGVGSISNGISPPKYDPIWVSMYHAERERISYERMVELT